MAVKRDPVYEKEYNCLTTDLVNGYPPADVGEDGSKMYVWDAALRKMTKIFKNVFGQWMEL